ncbi:MAG: hypothetical protein ABJA98_09575 [Acidobacteriota bacterium]
MKSPADRWELSLVVTGLMAWMLVMMWAGRADKGCALPFEEPRRLVLSREVDREHLAADLASADRIARRYQRSTENPAERRTRLLECHTTLEREIAARHGVPVGAGDRSVGR